MKQVSREEMLNLWLEKYHNITVQEVLQKYPEECKSPDWFKLFPCTPEQYQEWERQAKLICQKKYKIPKRYLEETWWIVSLSCSPYIGSNN